MKLLKEYFKLQEEIHKHFGYQEDWVCIPLSDETDSYWMITGPEDTNETSVVRSPAPFTVESIVAGNNLYSGKLYTQRFLSKWVYRTEDYTMVCVDTQTDGNKFLMVFDNQKECKNPVFAELYNVTWGSL